MDFNETDFAIFHDLFQKRPEISAEGLKKDLQRYYLPFAQKLIAIKMEKSPTQGLIIGVSAIQGAGKTTQGEIMDVLLTHLGHATDSLSIDDHYITHKQLCQLRDHDPRFIRRGVTHDIPLALRDLKKLQTMEEGKPILISSYDKGVQSGDGDRLRWVNLVPGLIVKAIVVEEELMVNKKLETAKALQLVMVSFNGRDLVLLDNMGSDIPVKVPFLTSELISFLTSQTDGVEISLGDDQQIHFKGDGEITLSPNDLPHGWKVVSKKPDFIFYDGWMLGARTVKDEAVFSSGLPALETEDAQQFAKDINKKLADYEKLWGLFGFLNLLYVPNYQISVSWRDQAEEALREKGEGMTPEQITEFVHYFWRSVHPAIHIKNLAHDEVHTNQVVIINDDHSVGDILTSEETKLKYP